MEPTASLQLTEKEAVILSQLIDIAVKSGGIQVAGPAAEIHSKLFAACAIFRPETKDAELEVVS
jgi:hypothetical protein